MASLPKPPGLIGARIIQKPLRKPSFLRGSHLLQKALQAATSRLSPAAKLLSVVALLTSLLVLLGTATAHTVSVLRSSKSSAVYTVTATAYEAVAGQTDSKPFITADNSRIPRSYGSHTRWLALSRDLLKPWGGPFAFGDKVQVDGISSALDGEYTVHDTMHPRFRHRLDVLAHPREHLSLSRTGVKLRRVGTALSSRKASRKRTHSTAKINKAVSAQRHKAQPHQPVAQPAAKRRKPTKGLAKATKRAARPARRQPRASLSHSKPRVAKQLTASSKRPQAATA